MATAGVFWVGSPFWGYPSVIVSEWLPSQWILVHPAVLVAVHWSGPELIGPPIVWVLLKKPRSPRIEPKWNHPNSPLVGDRRHDVIAAAGLVGVDHHPGSHEIGMGRRRPRRAERGR
jgi:hypothetical protein